MPKPEPMPLQLFLAPLAVLARKHPEIEALVFWGGAAGWDDSPSEALEAEEIAFYAEGLLQDGFHMRWDVVALADSPGLADHVRLQFWQDDSPPPPVFGWVVLESALWSGV